MAHKFIRFAVILFFLQILNAQNLVFRPHKFGNNLFAGGIDNPRFQFVDIDHDGDPDLFILDRDGGFSFFRNIHSQFVLEPETTFGLSVGTWFHFADIDNDGDMDCMTNVVGSEVSVYTNIGSSSSPQFIIASAVLTDASGNELYSEPFSIPTFADIDGDGDLDFFSGSSIGSISYYKNIGNPVSPAFAFITSTLGDINIQGGTKLFAKRLHGASGIEFFDADSNGTLDLFWGDYFNPSLYFLKNTGTKFTPNIALHDSTYPKEEKIYSLGFNIPQHVDIDGDGAVDLMIGCVFPNCDHDNFMFYKNIKTNTQPLYALQTKNFIPMIDAGSRSTVTAADYDGDGDIDLCIGSAGGTVSIYQNIGSAFQPKYSTQPTYSISLNGDFYLAVSSADINGDGKQDLIIGTFDGKIKTFVNTSAAGDISFVSSIHPLNDVTVGQNAAPFSADIDNDGLIDVLVGNYEGKLLLLKNIGTNAAPSYQATPFFNSIDVGNDAIPFVGDSNGDGKRDLLVGNSIGTIYHFQKTSPTATTFDLVSKNYQSINLRTQSSPFMIDLDSDGDKDLLLGNGKGGILFYENTNISSVSNNSLTITTSFELWQNYPNPFNPSTIINYQLTEAGRITLRVYDIMGKEISTLVNGEKSAGLHSVSFNAEDLSGGVYFYSLESGKYKETRKLILLK